MIATIVITSRVNAPSINNQGQPEPVIEELKPTPQPVPEVRIPKKTYTRAELEVALTAVAKKYGQSYEMMSAVLQCESGWQVDPPRNGISFGIAQFTIPTWHDFGYGDIMDPYIQLEVMGKMWSMGLNKRWDCYKMLYL